MSTVSQLPSMSERKERRRLHLRDVAQEGEPSVAAQTEGEPTESLGATLRAARIERGEEPAAIAAILKMRRDQLLAIEDDNFDRLPGRTYAAGFVRSYARHLGLDAGAMVQRFKDEVAGKDNAKPAELVFPEAPEEQRALPNGSILIWAMLVAMVIYGISYLTLPNRKTPTTTAKAEELGVIIEQPKPVETPAPQASIVPAPESSAPEAATVSFVVGNDMLPDSAQPAQDLIDTSAFPTAASFVVAQLADPPPATQPDSGTADSRITLKATEPAYIQVKDLNVRGAGGVLISRVLAVGESYSAPNRPGLLMQTGNAGGLHVEVDGRAVGTLGKSGEVITRIPVDPSYFLERLAASQ